MIGLAAANAVIQFGVIVVALRVVADQQKRSVIVTIAGTAQALTLSGLVLATVPADVLMAVGVWILYAALGVGMAVAVVMGIRAGGATRFRWHTSRYAKWRKTHPMPSYDDLQEV